MANTSCNELAERALKACLAGRGPAVQALLDRDCSEALFRVVVEGLADRFEPRLCDAYADLFCQVIARVLPEYDAAGLRARYERVRRPRVCTASPRDVFVLSRVTLGADIAVTSVLLDAAKQRFPDAEIHLVGSAKSAGLFALDPRIRHVPAPYPRAGSLHDRLASRMTLDASDSIVIDPDSRLTQLGLLPVCEEERYFFFESRAYGGDGDETLVALTQRWAESTFGVRGSAPYIAPQAESCSARRPRIAVSLGIGENPAKRIGDPFEAELLRYLSSFGGSIIIDKGAGGEEAERVERAIAGIENATTWSGSFAGFTSLIAQSDLYAGYDSAGQHAAAALGIPLVAIFAGYASDRMFQRWKPSGRGRVSVLKVTDRDPALVLAALRHRLRDNLLDRG